MSEKDAEVLKAVRKATEAAGNKVPEIYVQEFEAALKKKHESKVLKKKADALLKRLKTLSQREPNVKKAMELVSELTQISGSSAGSPRFSESSSFAQKAIKERTTASGTEDNSPLAFTPFKSVQGTSVATTLDTRSTPSPQGAIGDHGKVFRQFVSELNLILSFKQDRFTDKTIEDSSTFIKEELENLQKNIRRCKESMQTAHTDIVEVNSQLDEIEKRLIAPYQKQDPSRKQLHEAQNRSPSSKSGVVRRIKVMVDNIEEILEEQNSELHWHERNKRDNERKISEMWAEADQLRAEKNELITRLSNIAGAKLADDKPNIADLSDQNRPTKLAEKYRETYDTEWTDAYEVLEMEFKYQEKDACTALVRILMDVYDRCNDIAKTQESGLRWYLLNPLANPNDLPQDLKGEDEKDIRSKMIDFRRHTADISIKNIKKGFPKYDELFRNKTICKYRNECIEIFWYMGLQTPPVVLERPPTGNVKFDKKKYSEYTKKGTHLDFVTLPPMLLQEDGPLLCKGIAQGK